MFYFDHQLRRFVLLCIVIVTVNCGGSHNGTHPVTAATATPIPQSTSDAIPDPSPDVSPAATATPIVVATIAPSAMSIGSPAFKDTGSDDWILPLSYTCDGVGGGQSPLLTWQGVPASAQSLVLTMAGIDDDSVQFTLFNINPATQRLAAADMSIGVAANGDMPAGYSVVTGGAAYSPPCASGAGSLRHYKVSLYALSDHLDLPVSTTREQVLAALDNLVLAKSELTVKRIFWDAEAIANNLHVPTHVPSTCEEKTAHFMAYSRMHKSISCDPENNQMDIVSYISDGLKTTLNDQQVQVGIHTWIGRLSFPSQAGGEIRIVPSYLEGVHNNISCDGTGKLGISVDGQIILPYYKQTNDSGGDNCGPTDGNNYADRDTVVLGEVDQCYGHSPNGEGYHLHGAPICLMDVHDPSQPVAYMSDGIPLYFGQAGGTIENTPHAQTAKTVTDTNFGAGLYEHLDYRPSDVKDGTNPLNECNAYDINGDGAVSGYVYYTTKEAPYSIGCFMGELLDSPTPVAVSRTNFSGSRSGWTGQTVGEGIAVNIVSNFIGDYNNKTYNITEMLVTASSSYLTKGDYAQVLWRPLDADDSDYSTTSTCFELRYRANKNVTDNDEVERVCSRNVAPTDTLNFSPFSDNSQQAQMSSATASNTTDVGERRFKLEAWADNWFAAYLGEQLIVEDSVPITTERSFNAETAVFSGHYPLQLNVILKDFKENDTGLEYIGQNNQQMGDGGFIAQITDIASEDVIAVSNDNWKCTVIHRAPLDKTCENEANPIAGVAPCDFFSSVEPPHWLTSTFDDSAWPYATEHTAEAVGPKDGYDDIAWDLDAKFIWGPDLETDNTLLCRMTIEAP